MLRYQICWSNQFLKVYINKFIAVCIKKYIKIPLKIIVYILELNKAIKDNITNEI